MIAAPFLFMPNRTDYAWYCDGACDGFRPAPLEESALPLLANAQAAAVGSKQSRANKRISNEALHIPRERDKKVSPTRNSAAVRAQLRLRMIESSSFQEKIPYALVLFTVWLRSLSRL